MYHELASNVLASNVFGSIGASSERNYKLERLKELEYKELNHSPSLHRLANTLHDLHVKLVITVREL
jgi:hypothetical protein